MTYYQPNTNQIQLNNHNTELNTTKPSNFNVKYCQILDYLKGWNSFLALKNSTGIEKISINKFQINLRNQEKIQIEILKGICVILVEVNRIQFKLQVSHLTKSKLLNLLELQNTSKFLKSLVEQFTKQNISSESTPSKLNGGGCTVSKTIKKQKKLKELTKFQTSQYKTTQQSNYLLTKENNNSQIGLPQDSIIRLYRFGESVHSEFQKKYDKYKDEKKIQNDIKLNTQVFEMHQMFTKCIYNFKPLIAQNSEGYRIMIFEILQVYQQYMLTGLVSSDQFIQKDIKEHINEIEDFIQYLKVKVNVQPCLDLVFLSDFYLDINKNRVGLDQANQDIYKKLADFMCEALIFSMKAAIAVSTGAVFELLPDIVEFVVKVCSELNNIREYHSNQSLKVDGVQIKNMKFLFLFNLYKAKLDKFNGAFLSIPAEKEIEFLIEQFLIFRERKIADQYLLYILVQINFLFDVVLYEKSSKSDFQGIKNIADLMRDFIDILRQKSKNREKEQQLKGFYNFMIKNATFRFLAISILIKYRIILGKIPNRQEEQQQITIHLIHSLLSEKNDSVKVLFKKDQKLIDIAKQVIIDDSLSQEVINYAIQRNNSMREYQLDVVEEQIKSKQDIEKQIIRCLYEKWEDDIHRRQQSNIEQKDDVLLEVIQFYINQKITVIKGQFNSEDQKLTNAIDDIFELFLKPNFKEEDAVTPDSKEVQQNHCRILGILAEGGAGKSMLLKQIEVKLKADSENGLSYLPLFIKCNSLDAKSPSIESYLEQFDFPKEQIERLKQSDWNKLILLDGFDEYSGNYFNIYSQLKISEWKNTLIIVSTRQEKLSIEDASLYFSIKDDNFNIIDSSYTLVNLLEFQKKDIEIYYQQFFKKFSQQKEYDENRQKVLEIQKIKLMEDCLQNKQIEKLLYLPINLYLFTRLIAEIQDNSKRNIIDQITDQIGVQEYFFAQQFKREATRFIDDEKIQSKVYSREDLINIIISTYFDYFQTIAMHMFLNLSKKNFLQVKLKQIQKLFQLNQKAVFILNESQIDELKQKIYYYENSNIITRLKNLKSIKNNSSGLNNSDFYNILDQQITTTVDDNLQFDIIEFKHKSLYEYFAARAMKTDFDVYKEDICKLPITTLKQFNINKKTIINPGKNQSEYQILKKLYKLMQKEIDSQYFKETYYLDSIKHNNRYIQFLKRSSINISNEISEIDIGSSNLISVLFISNFQYPRLNLSKCSFSKAYIPQQKDESINLDYSNLSDAYLKGSNLNILYANTKNANFHNIQQKFNSKNTFSYKDVIIGDNNTIYTLSLTGYLNEFRIQKNEFVIMKSQCISQEPLFNLNMYNKNFILHTNNTLILVNRQTFRNQNQKRFPDRIKSIAVSTYNQILVITNSNQCYYGSFEFDFVLIKNLKGNHAMFSPTGNYLLITNNENKLEVRKVSDNFNSIASLFFKVEQNIIAAFTSDDSYLVVAQQSKLKVLKYYQNQFLLSEQFEIDKESFSDVISLAFSKNDQYLVISSRNESQIREFVQQKNSQKPSAAFLNQISNNSQNSFQSEFQIKIQNFTAINQRILFTYDNQYAIAFNMYQMSIYDSDFNLLNTKKQNPTQEIKSFAISPDESHTVLYSLDDCCKFLNTNKNYQLLDQYDNNTLVVSQMAFSSDGIYFAVCFADKTCYIRNAKNLFKHKTEISIELTNQCIVDFCRRNEKEYLTIVSDLRYYVLDVADDFEIIINKPLENVAAAISKNGQYIAYCRNNSCIVFDIYEKNQINIIKEDKYFDANKLIAFSGDSKYFAQSFEKNKCQIWLLEKQQKKTLTCHDQQICALAFSGDGQYFATSSLDQTCKLWSVNTDFDLIDAIDCQPCCINYLTFYPHRNILVACDSDFSFQLWDVEKVYLTSNKPQINQGNFISSQFSADGKYLALGTSEGYCRIWNVKNFKSLLKIKVHSKAMTQIAFSSNGKYLVTSSEDKTCRVIEIQNNNFKLLNVVIYHFGPIIQIAISQDCKYLATTSKDKKCNIWNIKEGFKFQSTLRDNTEKVNLIILQEQFKKLYIQKVFSSPPRKKLEN